MRRRILWRWSWNWFWVLSWIRIRSWSFFPLGVGCRIGRYRRIKIKLSLVSIVSIPALKYVAILSWIGWSSCSLANYNLNVVNCATARRVKFDCIDNFTSSSKSILGTSNDIRRINDSRRIIDVETSASVLYTNFLG